MDIDYCPECREERTFETPPCPDGHAECPERVCVVCGFAVLVGWLAVDAARAAARAVVEAPSPTQTPAHTGAAA